jgi:hypothetical protein
MSDLITDLNDADIQTEWTTPRASNVEADDDATDTGTDADGTDGTGGDADGTDGTGGDADGTDGGDADTTDA